MINTTLLKPQNVIVITAIAVISHIIAKPIYNKVSRKEA